MSVKALSRFGAQVIAMYKQMAGSSIGALGPLELSLALKRAGISMPLCICSTLPLRMRLAHGLCPAHEVLYAVVVGTHTSYFPRHPRYMAGYSWSIRLCRPSAGR
jgi:hypothetical protein